MMSDFSDLLSHFITQKNIKVYSMVKYCKIDRSTMYKLINGKRNPPSKEIFDRIAEFMHLTSLEYCKFQEAYYITIMGKEKYYQRKGIEDFIINFPDNYPLFHHSVIPASLPAPGSEKALPACLALTTRLEIEQLLHRLITEEVGKSQGRIALFLQPDNDFLFSLLSSLGSNRDNLRIEHILCLNKAGQLNGEQTLYNLTYLEKILPMYIYGLNYHPYYFYDDIQSHHYNFNGFSYLILTSEYAVNCTSDYQYGIMYHDEKIVDMLWNLYYSYQGKCSPLFLATESLIEESKILGDIGWDSFLTYTIQPEPCLIPFITPEFLEKVVSPLLPDRNILMNVWEKYIESAASRIHDPNLHIYYSSKGILKFAETGRLSEIPDSIYRPFTIEERIFLLESLYRHCITIPWRIMKEPLKYISPNFHLCINDASGYLLFNNASRQQLFLIIEEPSLLSAFLDYAESLDDNGLLYTAEETANFIKEVIVKLKGRL